MTSFLDQMDDYCGIDYDSTWPATAPASGSGHVANPTIQHANAAVAMFARGVATGSLDGYPPLAPSQGKGWPEGKEVTTTATAEIATTVTAEIVTQTTAKASIRNMVLKPMIQQCTWDKEQKKWNIPAAKELLDEWNWAALAKLDGWQAGNLTSARPMFYTDEPDANQDDKPRLDILLSMSDGTWVRYHPSADTIHSTAPVPSQAVQNRYNRRKNLLKKESEREHW